jgi:hypothetical protein
MELGNDDDCDVNVVSKDDGYGFSEWYWVMMMIVMLM